MILVQLGKIALYNIPLNDDLTLYGLYSVSIYLLYELKYKW